MKWILPYQGRDWVFDDSRLTAGEARLQKRLCGGSTPSAAGTARFELDPDALVAALVIARKRAGLPIEEAVSIDDDELDLTAVAEATEKAAKVRVAVAIEPDAVDEPADEIVRADVEFDPASLSGFEPGRKRPGKAKVADPA